MQEIGRKEIAIGGALSAVGYDVNSTKLAYAVVTNTGVVTITAMDSKDFSQLWNRGLSGQVSFSFSGSNLVVVENPSGTQKYNFVSLDSGNGAVKVTKTYVSSREGNKNKLGGIRASTNTHVVTTNGYFFYIIRVKTGIASVKKVPQFGIGDVMFFNNGNFFVDGKSITRYNIYSNGTFGNPYTWSHPFEKFSNNLMKLVEKDYVFVTYYDEIKQKTNLICYSVTNGNQIYSSLVYSGFQERLQFGCISNQIIILYQTKNFNDETHFDRNFLSKIYFINALNGNIIKIIDPPQIMPNGLCAKIDIHPLCNEGKGLLMLQPANCGNNYDNVGNPIYVAVDST